LSDGAKLQQTLLEIEDNLKNTEFPKLLGFGTISVLGFWR
jgi:hypothetical protein